MNNKLLLKKNLIEYLVWLIPFKDIRNSVRINSIHLKDLGYKMLIIPCTSLKGNSCNPGFELDIDVMMENVKTKSRLQLSEIRCVDMQRLDLRKPFCNVLSTRKEIINYVEEHLLK